MLKPLAAAADQVVCREGELFDHSGNVQEVIGEGRQRHRARGAAEVMIAAETQRAAMLGDDHGLDAGEDRSRCRAQPRPTVKGADSRCGAAGAGCAEDRGNGLAGGERDSLDHDRVQGAAL